MGPGNLCEGPGCTFFSLRGLNQGQKPTRSIEGELFSYTWAGSLFDLQAAKAIAQRWYLAACPESRNVGVLFAGGVLHSAHYDFKAGSSAPHQGTSAHDSLVAVWVASRLVPPSHLEAHCSHCYYFRLRPGLNGSITKLGTLAPCFLRKLSVWQCLET